MAAKKPAKSAPKQEPPSITRRKYRRIYEMSQDVQDVMNGMFADGKPVSEIMNTLRMFGYFKDVSDVSFRQYLYRYKWDVVEKNFLIDSHGIGLQKQYKVLAEVVSQIDVLQEMTELIVAQKSRVSKLLRREQEMPMLFNSLGGEMKTLAGFVQQYANLSFDLGTLKKAPQVTKISKEGEATVVESEGRDHVMFNLENTKQIEEAAKAFFDVLNATEDENAQSL